MESRIAFKRIHCKVLTTLPNETIWDSTEMRFLGIKVEIRVVLARGKCKCSLNLNCMPSVMETD